VLYVDEKIKEMYEKAGYRVYKTGAVEICHWTKEALKNKRFCYKNKFYGIDTHRCMQISLAAFWCTNRCIYCWRPNHEFQKGHIDLLNEDWPDPKDLLENLRKLRAELLIGFKGNEKVDKKMLEEALLPNHVTFSLIGEPLLYGRMDEAILYLKKSWHWLKSIFIVTNGVVYETIEKLIEKNALPTQFYISFTAPNEELFFQVSKPLLNDAWKRFNKSLKLMRHAKTRKVARITLIKGINDTDFEGWASLIEKYNPHFVEVKAFMLLGYSRQRLTIKNMPTHEEVKEFAKKLSEYIDYDLVDEHVDSRVVLLQSNKNVIDRKIRGIEQ